MGSKTNLKWSFIAASLLVWPSIGGFVHSAWGQATFQGLGFLPGPPGFGRSGAQAISADGSVVVGYSSSVDAGHVEGFRWTQDEGMVGLGFLTDFQHINRARGVSADGAVVVGVNQLSFTEPFKEAFRWTAQGGLEGLGYLPTPGVNFSSSASDVSGNGEAVVGIGIGGHAMRWTREEGMIDLGFLPGGLSSQASGVSADGSVVVGSGGLGGSVYEAFRWTQETGMVGLGGFLDENDPAFFSSANAISSDGSVIVGSARVDDGSGSVAFRWTALEGMVKLGQLSGGIFGASALAVSDDGSVIVGVSDTDDGFAAFMWDPVHEMRNLRDVLVNEFGLDLTGWTLSYARDISSDGLTIVGQGNSPQAPGWGEAWMVTLRSPCPADLNGDGIVDAFDLVQVAHALRTRGDVPEDLDGDGVVTPRDLHIVIRNFGPCSGTGRLTKRRPAALRTLPRTSQ